MMITKPEEKTQVTVKRGLLPRLSTRKSVRARSLMHLKQVGSGGPVGEGKDSLYIDS